MHRKGATRAFLAGSGEIPEPYRSVGQRVFIRGSMGTSSFVLVGAAGSIELAFGTTWQGRAAALSHRRPQADLSERASSPLETHGIVVCSPSNKGLAEEAPLACKDVDASLTWSSGQDSRRVARLFPLGVIKGANWIGAADLLQSRRRTTSCGSWRSRIDGDAAFSRGRSKRWVTSDVSSSVPGRGCGPSRARRRWARPRFLPHAGPALELRRR